MDFRYAALMREDADQWQSLRLEGVRDFPIGFLVTEEEAATTSLERAADILASGSTRGVFGKDTLAGFCGFRRSQLERLRHRAEIGPFFVAARFQGTGAAGVLMSGVIDEARAAGVEQLELFVDTENVRAIRFYQRFGFKQAARFIDSVRIDGRSRDDDFMTLRISGA
ncbi:MAG: GNAT family N-acetyltransferase [Pseudomonadota bacterium]